MEELILEDEDTESFPHAVDVSSAWVGTEAWCHGEVQGEGHAVDVYSHDIDKNDTGAIVCKAFEIPKEVNFWEALTNLSQKMIRGQRGISNALLYFNLMFDYARAIERDAITQSFHANMPAVIEQFRRFSQASISRSLIKSRIELRKSSLAPPSGGVLLWGEVSAEQD